jgi:hypothetical protein
MTNTTEQIVLLNLAALHQTLLASGLRTVYTYAPFAVPANVLPAAIVFTGPDTPTGKKAPGWYELVRDYECRFYVIPIQAGETGVAEQSVVPFIALGRGLYLGHPSLNPGPTTADQVPFSMDSEYMGCTGVAVLPDFAGTRFLGVAHRLKITYKVPYNYGNYE